MSKSELSFVKASDATAESLPIGHPSSLADLKLTRELVEYCERNQISDSVLETIALAHKYLAIVDERWYALVDDPESQEHYLAIHVKAAGGAELVFEQSEALLDEFIRTTELGGQERVNLVYHAI